MLPESIFCCIMCAISSNAVSICITRRILLNRIDRIENHLNIPTRGPDRVLM